MFFVVWNRFRRKRSRKNWGDYAVVAMRAEGEVVGRGARVLMVMTRV